MIINDVRTDFRDVEFDVPDGYFLDPRFNFVSKEKDSYVSMTKQSFANEVDINQIVARFSKTGLLPTFNGQPFYGDVSEIGDFQEAMNVVASANELFNQYPAEIRERFGNDAGQLIEFLSDENNRDEAIALGLVVKPVDPVVDPIAPLSQPKAENKGTGV